jgi:hypothetical protein
MSGIRSLLIGTVLAASLAACGPSYAPLDAPSRPCPEISEAAFEAALADGAARGDARIHPSGRVDLSFGPGVVHCASFNSSERPCRRPNDLVIRYEIDGEQTRFVHIPAQTQYRFQVRARPTTCQIVNED